MKKLLFYYLLMLALLGSCAALKPKREVVDNILTSNSPKMRVKIDPSLTYLGDFQYSTRYYADYEFAKFRTYADYESGKLQHPHKVHAFVFVTAEEYRIKKILTIKIQRMTGTRFFSPDQLDLVFEELEKGNLRFSGKWFQYYNRVVFPSMADSVTEYAYNNGYSHPACGLMIRIVRVKDRGKTLLKFDYLEDISDPDYDCTSVNWKSKAALSDKQRDLLDQINKNCMAAFEVL